MSRRLGAKGRRDRGIPVFQLPGYGFRKLFAGAHRRLGSRMESSSADVGRTVSHGAHSIGGLIARPDMVYG
jgi:hypothetical protein